jgi:hypothetical protein
MRSTSAAKEARHVPRVPIAHVIHTYVAVVGPARLSGGVIA